MLLISFLQNDPYLMSSKKTRMNSKTRQNFISSIIYLLVDINCGSFFWFETINYGFMSDERERLRFTNSICSILENYI